MTAIELERIRKCSSDESTLAFVQVLSCTTEMLTRHCFCSIDAIAHFNGVEIHFHNPVLVPEYLDKYSEIGFKTFSNP